MSLNKQALKLVIMKYGAYDIESIISDYISAIQFPAVKTLSPTQTDVYHALIDNYPNPISAERIGSIIYDNARNGGPLNARNVVHVLLNQMRKRLEGSGVNVSKLGTGQSGGYVLIFEEKSK